MVIRIRTYLKMLIPTVLLAGWALSAFADGPEYANIVERIEMESNGNVIIQIDSILLEKILTDPGTTVRKKQIKDPNAQRSGFRIQVFSDGRNQSTLEARAKARGNAIVAKFPKYRGQIYTYSSAPNWYTRVGNFRNEEDARKALDELKRSFPSFSSEMRIVRSKINPR